MLSPLEMSYVQSYWSGCKYAYKSSFWTPPETLTTDLDKFHAIVWQVGGLIKYGHNLRGFTSFLFCKHLKALSNSIKVPRCLVRSISNERLLDWSYCTYIRISIRPQHVSELHHSYIHVVSKPFSNTQF